VKIYMISANANDVPEKKYSQAVVVAETEEDARRTHPDGQSVVAHEMDVFGIWVSLEHVRTEYLGEAKAGTKAGVVLASYIFR
jgi:hypothetical protein